MATKLNAALAKALKGLTAEKALSMGAKKWEGKGETRFYFNDRRLFKDAFVYVVFTESGISCVESTGTSGNTDLKNAIKQSAMENCTVDSILLTVEEARKLITHISERIRVDEEFNEHSVTQAMRDLLEKCKNIADGKKTTAEIEAEEKAQAKAEAVEIIENCTVLDKKLLAQYCIYVDELNNDFAKNEMIKSLAYMSEIQKRNRGELLALIADAKLASENTVNVVVTEIGCKKGSAGTEFKAILFNNEITVLAANGSDLKHQISKELGLFRYERVNYSGCHWLDKEGTIQDRFIYRANRLYDDLNHWGSYKDWTEYTGKKVVMHDGEEYPILSSKIKSGELNVLINEVDIDDFSDKFRWKWQRVLTQQQLAEKDDFDKATFSGIKIVEDDDTKALMIALKRAHKKDCQVIEEHNVARALAAQRVFVIKKCDTCGRTINVLEKVTTCDKCKRKEVNARYHAKKR